MAKNDNGDLGEQGDLMAQPQTVRIILDDNPDIPPTGLFIGHNGRPYMLQVNMPAEVPVALLNILDDAITSSPVIDPQTRQISHYIDRPRYPYRRLNGIG